MNSKYYKLLGIILLLGAVFLLLILSGRFFLEKNWNSVSELNSIRDLYSGKGVTIADGALPRRKIRNIVYSVGYRDYAGSLKAAGDFTASEKESVNLTDGGYIFRMEDGSFCTVMKDYTLYILPASGNGESVFSETLGRYSNAVLSYKLNRKGGSTYDLYLAGIPVSGKNIGLSSGAVSGFYCDQKLEKAGSCSYSISDALVKELDSAAAGSVIETVRYCYIVTEAENGIRFVPSAEIVYADAATRIYRLDDNTVIPSD